MCTAIVHNARTLIKSNQSRIRRDPSRTSSLRSSFSRQMRRRFDLIAKLIIKAVWTEDVFGIRDEAATRITTMQHTPGRRAFDFPRNSRKVQEFMDWLDRMVMAEVLDVRNFSQVGEGVERAWTNRYIYDSYKRGVQRARYQMRQAGFDVPPLSATGGLEAAMNTPFHIDRVGLLFTRTFNDLRGITQAMDQSISRILSIGLANGEHPRELARRLTKVITGPSLGLTDTLGRFIPARRRAELLARTEIIRAHAQGQLQEFQNWRVEGVRAMAEFVTAQDDRVCPICGNLEGSILTIEEAWNVIPVHPQCRCIWLPYTVELERAGLITRVEEVNG